MMFMPTWSEVPFEGVDRPLAVNAPSDYSSPPERIFLNQEDARYPDIAGGSLPEQPRRLFIRHKDEIGDWHYKRPEHEQPCGAIGTSYDFTGGGRDGCYSVPLQSHGLPADRVYVNDEGVHPDEIKLRIRPDSACTYLRRSDESGGISYVAG
jgi:hypothetical protein